MNDISKVSVIGAGTMGSGIAAQVANAGIDVLLLDVKGNADQPNEAALSALERIKQSDPPLLMVPENIARIETGNIKDDLPKISQCDWVCEAIVERLDVKRQLYRNMMSHLHEEAMVSSNTSTIPISLLMADMPEALRKRFCITHFFNPVRYMRLLELVRGEETDQQVMDLLADFNDRVLGKGVVQCADTPGFLGNRVGVFAMQAAIHEATRLGIKIEEADSLFGRPMGIPKTGAFGLYDLIGLDLMADVVRSLRSILPDGDAFQAVGDENDLINAQVARGYTGNKGRGGFYREDENGNRYAVDLVTGQWRERITELSPLAQQGEREGLAPLLDDHGVLGTFSWNVLARILTYSASLLPDVTTSPQDIDDAMKLGYNWVKGPFELLDEIGNARFVERLRADGRPVPDYLEKLGNNRVYETSGGMLTVRHFDGQDYPVELPEGVVRFHMKRQTLKPVQENAGASLFHLEGGVRLVEFHTKANALDADCMAIVRAAAEDPGPGIMVHNDAQHFSAGVNLERFLAFIKAKDWQGIDEFLKDFQEAVHAQLYCPVPVVGAPSGLAIGGGFEVLAHCDKVVAHANSVMGLVEALVGLVPSGGGVKETYWRWYLKTGDWDKAAWNTFNQLGYGQTGTSPHLSAQMTYFVEGRDVKVMNRDRLISTALEELAVMGRDYQPRIAPNFRLAGQTALDDMVAFLEKGRKKGWFFDHDITVATTIANIMCGPDEGMLSEMDMFARERAAFIALAQTPQTAARIEAMLSGRGGLRN